MSKKMWFLVWGSLATVIMLSMMGCGPVEAPPGATIAHPDVPTNSVEATEQIITVHHVVRIFMHQPNEFTYWYMTPGSSNRISSFTVTSSISMEVILDALPDDMWVKYWGGVNGSANAYSCGKQEIHLSSLDNVTGAGWTRQEGKHTIVGTTTVVQ